MRIRTLDGELGHRNYLMSNPLLLSEECRASAEELQHPHQSDESADHQCTKCVVECGQLCALFLRAWTDGAGSRIGEGVHIVKKALNCERKDEVREPVFRSWLGL